MKKKNLLLLGLAALLFCGFLFYSNDSRSQVVIEIPNFDDEDWCRCKDNGCYQGNWISFRRECGTTLPCTGAGGCG